MPDNTHDQNEITKLKVVKLSKRRSCELVNVPSPCVKKALFHLERLKKLTNVSDASSLLLHKQDSEPKKQIRFLLDNVPREESDNESLGEENVIMKSSTQGSGEPGSLLTRIQLTPKEVFNQVASLILRLENDRNATQRALEQERNRVKGLITKIDDLSRRRLTQLPEAVQKEHEACASDIVELEWHVAYTERHLDRSRAKLDAAQLLNTSLREDIEFVKEHCPLVEEKLQSEKEAMEEIKRVQKMTDEELEEARKIQEQAEEKYERAVAQADKERAAIRLELESIRKQLTLLKKDHSHAKSMHEAYLKKADESRAKLVRQDQEVEALETRIEEVKEEEQEEYAKIQELRETIHQVEVETGKLTKEKADLEKALEQMRSEKEEELAGLEMEYKNNLRKLRTLQENNKDIKYDIEDMKEEIKNSEKAIGKADRELLRYQKERERMEEQLRVANDDVANISMVNVELKNQLEKEEAKSQALEEALKDTAENLRKQVNEEMKQRTALEAKRAQNSKALLKGKSDNVKKKQMIERTLEETMQAVLKATEEVKRLQGEHDSTVKALAGLEVKLAEVNAEHAEVEEDLVRKKREVEPVESKLQEEQMELRERISELEVEETQLDRKLKDLHVSHTTMQKRYNNTAKNIKTLTDQFEELKIQLEDGEETNSLLKLQLEQAADRMVEREKSHKALMQEREEVKRKLEERVQEELETNRIVAERYRTLQSEHLDLKNRLMSLYESKVKMEVNIKDHKQLLALQSKLNNALEEYYRNRNDFNKAGLNKFKIKSLASNAMMTNVQKGLEVAVDNVSAFLRGQMDGSAAEEVHQAAMAFLG